MSGKYKLSNGETTNFQNLPKLLKNFRILRYCVQVQYCAPAQISLPVSPPQCTFKIKSCLKVLLIPDT